MSKKARIISIICLSLVVGLYISFNTAKAYTNPVKKVLVVVDYQVDFVDGTLGKNADAVAIENTMYKKIASYQKAGDLIVYTMDTTYPEGYKKTREGKLFGLHCVIGTKGWNLYGKIDGLLTGKAIMVKKNTFGSPDLLKVIQLIQSQGTTLKSIEVVGVSTSVCVLHNAVLLYNFFPDVPLYVDASCCAAQTPVIHKEALTQMKQYGIIVTNFK